MVHSLVVYREFERDKPVLLDDLCKVMGAGEWLDELGKLVTRESWIYCWESVWSSKQKEW